MTDENSSVSFTVTADELLATLDGGTVALASKCVCLAKAISDSTSSPAHLAKCAVDVRDSLDAFRLIVSTLIPEEK